MTDQMTDKTRIAFVDISVFDDGSVRGGVLITNKYSRPYEFRVTSPINPTQLQKILYGKTLVDYLYGELISIPLLKQVKESISIAVCRDHHLLTARPQLPFPFIAIRKSRLESTKEEKEKIILQTHKNFEGEKAQAEILLNEMADQIDIFEPFERVKLAVSEVHNQKIN